jgi:hypothetical protein
MNIIQDWSFRTLFIAENIKYLDIHLGVQIKFKNPRDFISH